MSFVLNLQATKGAADRGPTEPTLLSQISTAMCATIVVPPQGN
ncbi:hypothetical protein ACFVMC_21085 [Nocardia sp. NPDC127579]